MRAIFWRTGSAIQSAVAKWNLTSALEFTGKKGTGAQVTEAPGRLSPWVTTGDHPETKGGDKPNQGCPTHPAPAWGYQAAMEGACRDSKALWDKNNFQALNAQGFS